jgi:hypothetical protein
MEHNCPICQTKLAREHKISYIEYHCFPPRDDHHYAKRIKREDSSMLQFKVRLTESGNNLYLKVDTENGQSFVWSKAGSDERVKIDQIVSTDFSDIDKLREKIKTYLVFG